MRRKGLPTPVIALIVVLLIGGAMGVYIYSQSGKSPGAAAATQKISDTPAAPEDPDDEAVHVAPEHSLSVEEYINEGAPAIDKIWTGSDYAAAAKVLERLATADPSSLPRAESKRSGPYFARIVAHENIAPLTSSVYPLTSRIAMAAEIGPVWDAFPKMYAKAGQYEGWYDTEIAELSQVELELRLAMARLIADGSLDENDPAYPQRLAQVLHMQDLFADSVNQALKTMAATDKMRTGARLKLATALGKTLPDLVPEIAALQRATIPARIEQIAKKEPKAAVKTVLENLAQTLRTPRKAEIDAVVLAPTPALKRASSATTSATRATTQPAELWQAAVHADGRFMAEFPAVTDAQTIGIPPSNPKAYAFSLATEPPDVESASFSILCEGADPNKPPADQFNEIADFIVRPHKPDETHPVSLASGAPGMEAIYHTKNDFIIARFYIVKNRLYQLRVQGALRDEKTLRQDAERFFHSFRTLHDLAPASSEPH